MAAGKGTPSKKQVQLNVKMDKEALSKENAVDKGQDQKSVGHFNLEDKIKEVQPSSLAMTMQTTEKIVIKDEDKTMTMKISETRAVRNGDTAQNSSRASKEGPEDSLFKNSRIDKSDIKEVVENVRTKSRLDRVTKTKAKKADHTGRNAPLFDNEHKSSATYHRDPLQDASGRCSAYKSLKDITVA